MPGALTIRVDPRSGTPAVRQIADGIRILLVEGKLAPGEALPSVRRVAVELGVHFNTVAEAYRMLAGEGWLDLKHGRAAIVAARATPALKSGNWTGEFRSKLRSLVAQVRAEGAPPAAIADELASMAAAVRGS